MNPTFVGFVKKEMTQLFRDVRMRAILFVMPVFQLVIFGIAISTQVRNVRLAAWYPPHDRLSKALYRNALSQEWFIPAKIELERWQRQDPYQWIQSDWADAVLIAPPQGLEEAVARNRNQTSAPLQLLVNATNVIRAQSIEAYIQNILNKTLQEELKSDATHPPLNLVVRVLFNPSLETSHFLVPGVMSMLLCILTVLLTSMSLAREKELGTFETIIAAPLKTYEIILGKTLPYVLLGIIDTPLILSVAVFGFGVPIRGSLLVLGIVTFVYICCTVAIGTLISTIARTQQQAMLGGFIFLLPAVLFSGIMFPIENMPDGMRWIAYLNPIQYYVVLLRNIMLKGGDGWVILVNAAALAIIAIGVVTYSFKRFRHTLG